MLSSSMFPQRMRDRREGMERRTYEEGEDVDEHIEIKNHTEV